MNNSPSSKDAYVKAIVDDIDAMIGMASNDLVQLNKIAKYLKTHCDTGNLTHLHYTVDQERLQRTMAKCKMLLLTLTRHRNQALKLLKE